jgi:hypothetical protein
LETPVPHIVERGRKGEKGYTGSRDRFREKKRNNEEKAAGTAKRKTLSDSMFDITDKSVSPVGSSISRRRLQSDTMTCLAVKKLDHDIMKEHSDKFDRYHQCLEKKVVCEAPSVQPPLRVVVVVA